MVTATPRSLPVDTAAVFDRVRRLLGTGGTIEPRVEVVDREPAVTLEPSGFDRAIGLRAFTVTNRTGASAGPPNEIDVSAAYRTRPAALERTLAHEYVHLVQFRRGLQQRVADRLYPDEHAPTMDTRLVESAILEGHGQYAENAYWRRYQGDGRLPSARLRARYTNETGMFRLVTARYRYGARYLEHRGPVDNFRTLYRDLPRTYEQVLHPGSEDPVVPLNVTVNQSVEWGASADSDYQRAGELYVRLALRTELDRQRAVSAATGWGNDRVLTFTTGPRTAYVWILRFDDGANATEFRDAARDYARRREARADDVTVRVESVDDRTVALLFGPPAFVKEATIRNDDGDVRVVAPG